MNYYRPTECLWWKNLDTFFILANTAGNGMLCLPFSLPLEMSHCTSSSGTWRTESVCLLPFRRPTPPQALFSKPEGLNTYFRAKPPSLPPSSKELYCREEGEQELYITFSRGSILLFCVHFITVIYLYSII